MQVNCEFCHRDLKGKVREPFDKFTVGRLVCPYCHKENKRYLNEFDLMLGFFFSILLYTGSVLLINLILTRFLTDNWPLAFFLSGTALAVAYLLIAYLDKYIYQKAPFHHSTKNKVLTEDNQAVSRRLNQQFLFFMAISVLIGTNDTMLVYYLCLAAAFALFTGIKAYLLLKQQTDQIS